MQNTLIIDGHNLAFRSYHLIKGQKPDQTTSESKNDIIYIFLNSFLSYFKLGNFTSIIFVWDHKVDPSNKNYRKEVVAYKENREHKDPEIFTIIDELLTIVEKFGAKNILPLSLEADDIIYYLCKNKPGNKYVVSSDKDLLQLVDENTSVYSPTKKIVYNSTNFTKFMGMTTDEYIIYKAILGDTSDNIPGVPRYGDKKATKAAKNWEEYKNQFTPEQIEIVERNLKIMDLSNAQNHCDPSEYSYYEEQLNKNNEFSETEIKDYFRSKGFKKFLFNFHEWEKVRNSYMEFINIDFEKIFE